MNKIRRKNLEDLRSRLCGLREAVESVMYEEQEAYDNLPESLQLSGTGDAMSDAIDTMRAAIDCLEEAESSLEEAAEV